MDLYRRNANGELAEVLGAALANHDISQRVFGFRKTAHRIYDNLPADDRRRLDDYARGVNLFIVRAPGHAAGGVPAAEVQAEAMDRRRLGQHRA